MTTYDFMFALKEFTEGAIAELKLPVRTQETDVSDPADKTPDVYLMRLPDSTSAKKKAPYVLHQFVTGDDSQAQGKKDEDIITVRSVFCVYDEDEQKGALSLLELMERVRIKLLRQRVIDNRFELCMDPGRSLQRLVYAEDTAPYYVGEMVSTWTLPKIEREVTLHEQEKEYF